ncbi:Ankyrin repeat [Phytophthora cinnamomi]|uniref:Ankyrin repeat n=1 Tax=Phytophthora cinnamomi TaxID=4785 RepID=UPI00355A0D50|nr:Ankyrin repeat [Phytophthora cinnamomi]
MGSDDEGVAFRTNALDVVGSWLLGGDDVADANDAAQQRALEQTQRRPVTLYRPSSAGSSSDGKSLPSLTRPNAGQQDAALTEQEREMKRKLLRKPRGSRAEEAAKAELEAERQRDEAQDEEEQELVRLKTQAAKADKKRKRTAQDELLDKLREEAAKKKAKNQKRKLQLQRKKQQQREQQQSGVAAAN